MTTPDELLDLALTVAHDIRTRDPRAVLETLTLAAATDPALTARVMMTLAAMMDPDEPVNRIEGRVWTIVAVHHEAGRL